MEKLGTHILEVDHKGKRLYIEVCETWDFVRDVHRYQAHVVDKASYQRHIVGRYESWEIAVQKAREWIDSQ